MQAFANIKRRSGRARTPLIKQVVIDMKRLNARLVTAVTIAAAGLAGCASNGLYIPDVGQDPIVRESPTTETGSRIPRGKHEAVRDSPQRIDVFTEQDLEKQKPVSTREAVKRATRGF